ncbi:MAG: hypothetical protein NTY48_00400 [Candidatus Diapherotrites archaeon]|nr:hypothetical protein [Candidatus Diapherotrites archaeon]
MPNEEKIIENAAFFVKKTLAGETTGHDWWHSYRVWQLGLCVLISCF